MQTVEVLRVLDGDSIFVAYADGSTGYVDLAGVDAPDLYGGVTPDEFAGVPDTDGGRTYLYAWGWTAKRTLREMVVGESVTLRFVESASPAVDDYVSPVDATDARVAYVLRDGTDVNRLLLELGIARATTPDHPNRASYVETMHTAQNAHRGLWDTAGGLHVP